MTDKQKLQALEKVLTSSATFSEKAADKIAQHEVSIKYLSKVVAITAGIAGLGTGGVIGILTAPYALQFLRSLF